MRPPRVPPAAARFGVGVRARDAAVNRGERFNWHNLLDKTGTGHQVVPVERYPRPEPAPRTGTLAEPP